jgi:uncharacterized phiE125 gp8 family phage protein
MLEAYEVSAREIIESQTGRILTECTFSVYLDDFPSCDFYFSNGPIVSIDSIEYLVDGVWTAVSTDVYKMGRGGVSSQGVVLKTNQVWPTDKDLESEAVRINYTAGKANNKANQAIKLMVANWFENREAVVVGTSASELPLAVDLIVKSLKVYTAK